MRKNNSAAGAWWKRGKSHSEKTEAGTNKFPFRSCCSVIATSLITQGFLFPGKVLQPSACANIFQCPFLALCPPLTTGLAGHRHLPKFHGHCHGCYEFTSSPGSTVQSCSYPLLQRTGYIHSNKMLISWYIEIFPEMLIFALAFEVHLHGLFLVELIFSPVMVFLDCVHSTTTSLYKCFCFLFPMLRRANSWVHTGNPDRKAVPMPTPYSSPTCQNDVTTSFIHTPQT